MQRYTNVHLTRLTWWLPYNRQPKAAMSRGYRCFMYLHSAELNVEANDRHRKYFPIVMNTREPLWR